LHSNLTFKKYFLKVNIFIVIKQGHKEYKKTINKEFFNITFYDLVDIIKRGIVIYIKMVIER